MQSKFLDELRNDPVKLKKFLRDIIGPPRQVLEGKDKEHVMTLLALLDPFKETNNQHSWTSYYMIGPTEYHVTHFSGEDEPIVEKFLPEEE